MIMKHLIAAVVFSTAGSAFADATYPYVDHSKFTGTKTRAEVYAELERAYAQGDHIATNTSEFIEFNQVDSTRSREEVHTEAIRASRTADRVSWAGS
ncbi:DUF4148 domain-containing protein [Noviherbaspirillum sp. Root189]|uniref:DUF4148 domain-containing protein n=1 Tax=Noviherbaspirillum sp. Root189 TaxID=1736487 RepID=UPI000710D8D1|nr:DUF4148 domain-containing protein [Noviherbaspirillum sp. Root189]KRB82169.1 hypothetical protein ASE07_24035 [Noviherbaspirillum sp. Root189]